MSTVADLIRLGIRGGGGGPGPSEFAISVTNVVTVPRDYNVNAVADVASTGATGAVTYRVISGPPGVSVVQG